MLNKILSLLIVFISFAGNAYGQQQVAQEGASSRSEPSRLLLDVPEMQVKPVVKPITFQIGLLKVVADFVPEGAPAPHKGYILRRSDVGLIQTVIDSLPDDFTRECDARVDSCITEVESCQEDCNDRTALLIEDLAKAEEDLATEREQHDSTRLRYTLYGFGGAIVSSLTTVLVLRIAK